MTKAPVRSGVTAQAAAATSASKSREPGRLLQRKCACGTAMKQEGECEECRERGLQRKASGAGEVHGVPPVVDQAIASGGCPLDGATRAAMEARLGHDFSHVRVHTDGLAATSAREVHAQAYTVGDHVVFDAGRFAPATRAGAWLLAHELAHTVQQRLGETGGGPSAEAEADGAASAADAGAAVKVATPGGGALQRQAADEDVERTKIVKAAFRTTDAKYRAWEIVWRMLTRYFPEYSPLVAAVGYEANEKGVRVDVKVIEQKGKKVQSAVVTVGKRFVDDTSEEALRGRIHELGTSLWAAGLKAIPDPDARGGLAVWKIIHEKFPKKGMRVSGVSFDANLPGIRTEFGSGSVKAAGITVSWGGPTIYVGKAFLAIPDEGEKQAKIGAELAKVDKWSVENFRVFAGDLEDPDITLRIRGLSTDKLRTFADTAKDAKVKAYVESLVKTSTPAEGGLSRQADGSLTVMVGDVAVTVLADTSGTEAKTRMTASQGIRYTTTNGRVTAYQPGPKTVTIQTAYGSGETADVTSGYGRGTTERDKALEATTLRVHEGSHGLDFVQFVRDNPFPVFAGATNIPAGAADRAIAAFGTQVAAYSRRGEAYSQRLTDCVGRSIDEFNRAGENRAAPVCRP